MSFLGPLRKGGSTVGGNVGPAAAPAAAKATTGPRAGHAPPSGPTLRQVLDAGGRVRVEVSRTTRTVLRTASAVTLLDAVGYPLAHAFLLDATAGSDPAAFALALMDFPVPFLQMVLAAVLALLALAVALRSGWMHRLTEREVTASYVVMVGAGVLTIPLVIVLACCAVLVLLGALFVVLVFAVLLGALTG